jgi:hypothetical protein
MATKFKEMTGVVRNTCSCYYCPKCEVTFVLNDWSDECEECKSELVTFEGDCFGDCYDTMLADMENAFNEWSEQSEIQTFKVKGSGMTWQNLSGETHAMSTFHELMTAIVLRGDYTLRWKCDGENFNIVRSSHDEPLGAFFALVEVSEEE